MSIIFGIIKNIGCAIYYFGLCLASLPIFPSLRHGELSPDKPNIILVYGFLGMPKTFLPLKKKLEKLGYSVLIANVGWTIRDITIHAQRLLLFIKDRETVLHTEHGKTLSNLKGKITFFGHSMGGLIILEAQRLNPGLKTIKIITCGTPINGTYCAYSALFNQAARQMKPGSEFIKRLQKDIEINGRRLEQLKAELDHIVPSSASSLSSYPSQTLPIIGHLALVFCLSDEILKKF